MEFDSRLLLECLVMGVVGIRIYLLQRLEVKSLGEKLYAFYWLHRRHNLIGYIALFYLPIIFTILIVGLPWRWVFFIILLGDLILFRAVFNGQKLDSYEEFLEWFVSIKEEKEQKISLLMLTKPRPFWMLYGDEIVTFLIATIFIETA